MSLKFTEDFKRIAKVIAAYFVAAVLVFPVYHLIVGDFSWRDTLINVVIYLLVGLLIGVLYYFGSHVPKNNKE